MSYKNWLPNGHQYLHEYDGFYLDNTVLIGGNGEIDVNRYSEMVQLITYELMKKYKDLEIADRVTEGEHTLLENKIIRIVTGENDKYTSIYVVTQEGYIDKQKQVNELRKCVKHIEMILISYYTNYVFKRKGDWDVSFVG